MPYFLRLAWPTRVKQRGGLCYHPDAEIPWCWFWDYTAHLSPNICIAPFTFNAPVAVDFPHIHALSYPTYMLLLPLRTALL